MKGESMSRKSKAAALASLLLFIGGGAILSACGGGSVAIPDGPHMIYFYAQW
jgi:hypothetical protein